MVEILGLEALPVELCHLRCAVYAVREDVLMEDVVAARHMVAQDRVIRRGAGDIVIEARRFGWSER